jgi:hypothetical protein
MRFLIHGTIAPEIAPTLEAHGHKAHMINELDDSPNSTEPSGSAAGSAGSAGVADPAELLATLARRQWFLLTTDADLVHKIFEQKIASTSIIILLINAPDAATQSAAIDRLFERYKRLTPKRLYTVTPNRVKIRQLPGHL